ncbi:hypothetical protein, partial [Bartonella sp. AP58NXGY]|uniref:hypothetical protein n=1 Tax=Bartonella sp. AP58NXGY TaxID=3243498 RepID=UPI0035D0218C
VPGIIRNVSGTGSRVRVASGAGAAPSVASGENLKPGIPGGVPGGVPSGVPSGVGAVPGIPNSGVLPTSNSGILSAGTATGTATVVNVPQVNEPAGVGQLLALTLDTLPSRGIAGGLNSRAPQGTMVMSNVPTVTGVTQMPSVPGGVIPAIPGGVAGAAPNFAQDDSLNGVPGAIPGVPGANTSIRRARAAVVEAKVKSGREVH